MSVVVVGLEHERTPLDLLERVTVGDAELGKVLGTLRDRANLSESVVLSTCLRTEVYAVVDRFHDAVHEIHEILAEKAGVEVAVLEEHASVRFDDAVAVHLFSVASGLESAVLGEGEVLGQVRRSWERAQDERVAGPVLSELFRHALRTGKRVRSETAIARGTTSFSHAAVELAESRRPGGLAGATVVVVGAGEMGSGVLGALVSLSAGPASGRGAGGQPHGGPGRRPGPGRAPGGHGPHRGPGRTADRPGRGRRRGGGGGGRGARGDGGRPVLGRAAPTGRCWSWTSGCPATSSRRPGSCRASPCWTWAT